MDTGEVDGQCGEGGKRDLMRLRHVIERWSHVSTELYNIGVRYHGMRKYESLQHHNLPQAG